MPLLTFSSQLEAADSVLDLARLLGALCLEEADEIGWMRLDEQTDLELERIERAAGAASHDVWEGVVADPSTLENRLGREFVDLLEVARTRQPLDFLGVLRGLCRRALPELHHLARDQVGLDHGTPVPFATRPLMARLGSDCATSQQTLNRTSMLFPLPFSLFRFSASEPVRVALDYSHRDRIDELTWDPKRGLPRIATIHPPRGAELDVRRKGAHFFDVRPVDWDRDEILGLLASVKDDVEIAVLPELSLPGPRELEAQLAANPGEYPPIVVAGSAHCRHDGPGGGQIRSNESHVYLDGRCVAVARKHHPFATKALGEERFAEPLTEHLSSEQKTITVLSGRRTRLAVVICADSLDREIPGLLVDAGVNLLLVPAMTEKTGSFKTLVTDVAGYCQGVGAVANIRWGEDGKPFLCLLSVPREGPPCVALTGEGVDPPPQIAIFDPNEPLPNAVIWR